MKKNIEQLQLEANKARHAYEAALEEKQNKVLLPEMKKLVGRCFVYSNSYGVSDGRRTWPLYLKVIGIEEDTLSLKCIEFQRTTLEMVEVKLDTKITYRGENQLTRNDGWSEITNSEYNRAKKSLKKFLIEKLEL